MRTAVCTIRYVFPSIGQAYEAYIPENFSRSIRFCVKELKKRDSGLFLIKAGNNS